MDVKVPVSPPCARLVHFMTSMVCKSPQARVDAQESPDGLHRRLMKVCHLDGRKKVPAACMTVVSTVRAGQFTNREFRDSPMVMLRTSATGRMTTLITLSAA